MIRATGVKIRPITRSPTGENRSAGKEWTAMDRMFRVLGFWLLMIGLMFMAGEMFLLAILFGVQAILFFILGYMRYTERTYMLIFGGYMFLAFTGIVYWSFFQVG
jgi:hypothetical protein